MYSLEYNHMQHQINSTNQNIKDTNYQNNYIYVLDDAIYDWIIKNGREPKHIILNPNTWQYIGSQLGINGNAFELTTNNRYKGYKVLRSFDIEENFFEIG